MSWTYSRRLQSRSGCVETDELERLLGIVSDFPGGLGDVVVAQLLKNSDGNVPQRRHHSRRMPCPDLGLVLIPSDIPPPVEAVFYAPVTAYPSADLRGSALVRGDGSDGVDGFYEPLLGSDGSGLAGDLHGLDRVGKTDTLGECRAFDDANDLPPVGRSRGLVPDRDAFPGNGLKLGEVGGLVPFHGKDEIGTTLVEVVGMAHLRVECVGRDNHSGEVLDAVHQGRKAGDFVGFVGHRHLRQHRSAVLVNARE